MSRLVGVYIFIVLLCVMNCLTAGIRPVSFSSRAVSAMVNALIKFVVTIVTLTVFCYAVSEPLFGVGRWEDGLLAVVFFITLPCSVLCVMGLSDRDRKNLETRMAQIEGDLPARLADGTIRLIRVSWLLAQGPNYVIVRRQDLPAEAFIPVNEAVKLLHQQCVGVLSYRWLSKSHPDPESFHLRAVRAFFVGSKSLTPTALFWDFMSCHQNERTDDEAAAFKQALKVMTCLYASPNTSVLQHKRLPTADDATGFTPVPITFPADPEGVADYEHSGWCTMENAAASLSTVSGGTLYVLGEGKAVLHEDQRRTPEQMTAIFADFSRTRFLGKADRESVSLMYKDFHQSVLAFDEKNVPNQQVACNGTCAKGACLAWGRCCPLGCLISAGALVGGCYILWSFPMQMGVHHPDRAIGQQWSTMAVVLMVLSPPAFFLICCAQSVALRRTIRTGRIEPIGGVHSHGVPSRGVSLAEKAPVAYGATSRTREAPAHSGAQTMMMAVAVPAGMMGGMPLQVQTPTGVMQVVIPAGLSAGQSFQVMTSAEV